MMTFLYSILALNVFLVLDSVIERNFLPRFTVAVLDPVPVPVPFYYSINMQCGMTRHTKY